MAPGRKAPMSDSTLTPEHTEELRAAKQALETPGFAAQAVNAIGSPLEKGLALLPSGFQGTIVAISKTALEKAAAVAIRTLDSSESQTSRNLLHRLAVTVTGAAGGAFGLAALSVELPISTTIMLRSIADIARSEGEDIRDPLTRLSCMEVFALGGRASSDDAAESGYYAVRAGLAQAVGEAARYLASGSAAQASAPPIARLITRIASRFGVQVTEKAAAQAAPVVGAAGGALLNSLFMVHFQTMARGHFTVRRLERIYSPEVIQAAYEELQTGD